MVGAAVVGTAVVAVVVTGGAVVLVVVSTVVPSLDDSLLHAPIRVSEVTRATQVRRRGTAGSFLRIVNGGRFATPR